MDSRELCFVGWTCVASIWSVGSYAVFAPFFPLHADRFSLDRPEVGIIFGSFSVGQLIASPVAGPLASLLSRRVLVVAALIFLSLFTIGFGYVEASPWALVLFFALRFGQGASSTFVATSINSALAQAFPDKRSTIIGCVEVATSLGYSLAPAAGGVLYKLGGFRIPFIVVAMLNLITVPFLVAFWPADHPSAKSPKMRQSPKSRHWKKPEMVALVAMEVYIFCTWGAFDLGFTPWLRDAFGFGSLRGGLYFGVVGFAYMLGALPSGMFADHHAQRRRLMFALGFLGQGLTFVGFSPVFGVGQIGVVVLLFLNGLVATMTIVPALPEMLSLLDFESEDEVNRVSALYCAAMALGSAVGPSVGARAIDSIGFEGMLSAFGCIDLIIFGLVFVWYLFGSPAQLSLPVLSSTHDLLLPVE